MEPKTPLIFAHVIDKLVEFEFNKRTNSSNNKFVNLVKNQEVALNNIINFR